MILSDFLLPVIEYEISKIEEEGYRPAIYLSPRNAIELTLSINPYLCITEYSEDEENYPEQECGRIGTYKGAYVVVTKYPSCSSILDIAKPMPFVPPVTSALFICPRLLL